MTTHKFRALENDFRDLVAQGVGRSTIARTLNISEAGAYQYARKLGLTLPQQRVGSHSIIDRAARQIAAQDLFKVNPAISIRKLSELLECSRATAERLLHQLQAGKRFKKRKFCPCCKREIT